jgi:hypothetical protein
MTERQGYPWREEEDRQLLLSIQSNKSHDDIAREHRRTPRAISSRLHHIAVELHTTKGLPIDEICRTVGMPSEEVVSTIHRRTQLRRSLPTATAPALANAAIIRRLQKIRSDIDEVLQLMS